MNPMECEELDWLAFRYVAGELDSDEQADFERRLAQDQAACEAVAKAVELTGAIRAVEATSLPPVQLAGVPSRRWSLRMAACLSACAAILLIVYFQFSLPTESGPTVRSDPSSVTDKTELAVVWSEIRAELGDQENDTWAWSEVIDLGDSASAADDTDSLITPDWMFSAAIAAETDGPENLPEEREDG
jgi:hypothetical protein